MARLVILIGALLLGAMPSGASNAVSLGYSDETTIVGPERECSGGTLFHNHDGSFESGYGWQYGGEVPPYYGAMGEAYDLDAGTVACGVFWLACLDWDPLSLPKTSSAASRSIWRGRAARLGSQRWGDSPSWCGGL
jgi:hypothetical protein